MARPRRRRKIKNPSTKVTRRTANKHFKKVRITGHDLIAANWDPKATLRQNYQKLGLMSMLNAPAGGVEKTNPDNEEEVDVETLKNILGPDAGIIERDEEGN
ncbi:8810_t:CDS:2, partial [Paraglomus occultum]